MIKLSVALSAVLLMISLPIFLVFGIGSTFVAREALNLPWTQLVQTSVGAVSKHLLLAVPLFIFAGYVMVAGGMAARLVNLCIALVGHWPGGLGIAMVLAMGFFAAFCGSILAAITAIGTILMPRMIENGYPAPFVVVLAAMAALIEGLIPPSNAAIIYSALSSVPVAQTFAGILPGIVLALMLIVFVAIRCRNLPRSPRANGSERMAAAVAALPALVTPVIILGGIYGGFFTAAESAAVAGVWAIVAGFAIYRELTLRALVRALVAATLATAVIFVIIAMATLLSVILTFTGTPQALVDWFLSWGSSPLVFLLMIALACLVLGTFIEVVPIFYIIIPMTLALLPVLGVDPLHYYIVLAAFIGMGMLTPPVCLGLYTAAAVVGLPPQRAFPQIPLFFALGLGYGLLMILFPSLATWFPSRL
ncbi:TRAP transporter large permease [Pararhodobacter sp.]|uniref:TRAP transporter large permease n=1 Tax=Pararhodobacter sp. TaxID=2127056 RepID=UPI002AFFFC57|nr:TRAP transporter large permease [Pararhodobacter sp.]